MASETIFAYVGPKGSGKTHEGALAVCKMLLIGRRVVAVIPDLKVERVHAFLSQPLENIVGLFFDEKERDEFTKAGLLRQFDETVDQLRKRLIVCDYEAVDRDDFWPDEIGVRYDDGSGATIGQDRSQAAKPKPKRKMIRMGEDAVMFVGPAEVEEQKGPHGFRPTAWRESIVWCGSAVVIDESWRWLESKATMPKAFNTALRMARHWRGPLDWRDPEDVARWTADGPNPWHPGHGGPTGDGTGLVSTNVLFLTQDYHALDRNLRRQVDQICDIRSYAEGTLPPLIQWIGAKFPKLFPTWDVRGKYSVSTFASHRMPEDRQSKAYKNARKSWALRKHQGAIHGLFQKPGGQALEMAFDKRSSAGSDAQLNKLGSNIWMVFVILVICGFFGWRSFSNRYMAKPETVAATPTPGATSTPAPGATPAAGVAPAGTVQQGNVQLQAAPRPSRPEPVGRVVGVVAGYPVLADAEGNLHLREVGSLVRTDVGEFGDVQGKTVDRWSAPVGGGRTSVSNGVGSRTPGAVAGSPSNRRPVT